MQHDYDKDNFIKSNHKKLSESDEENKKQQKSFKMWGTSPDVDRK